jgi:hypothetical protein
MFMHVYGRYLDPPSNHKKNTNNNSDNNYDHDTNNNGKGTTVALPNDKFVR